MKSTWANHFPLPPQRERVREAGVRALSLAITALLLASCATPRVDMSTSPSPAVAWTPPPSAIPKALPKETFTLPAGFTPGAPITLAQVIDVALANNPTTRTAWLQARAAEAALGASRADYYPQVNVGAGLSRSRTASQATVTTFGPSVSLNYLLFDFGGREAAVEQARQTLISADFLHNQAIQDVVLRTQQAYYSYLDSKALLAAQLSTIKERETSLDAAEARHRAGVATIADVLQARTALSQTELNRETIQGNMRIIEGLLATTMGLPATMQFDFGELPLNVASTEVMAQVGALIERAAANRPELAAARADAERARVRIAAVRSEGMPSISLSSSAAQTWLGTHRSTTPFAAGVSLQFPLFTGFRNTFDIRRAELEAQAAAENVRATEQQVDLQVWTSYYALQTAAQRLTTSRDLLASAQQSADVARERYRAGVGNILDVLTAEAALESARAQEVQARADWFLSMAQLAHDTGTLTQETTR
jgi:outer membrane protein